MIFTTNTLKCELTGKTVDLHINHNIGIIICGGCKCCVSKTTLAAHVRRHGLEKLERTLLKYIVFPSPNILQRFFRSATNIPLISKLDIKTGFQCRICGYVSSSLSTLRKNCRQQHFGFATQRHSKAVKYQHLRNGDHSKFVVVNESQGPDDHRENSNDDVDIDLESQTQIIRSFVRSHAETTAVDSTLMVSNSRVDLNCVNYFKGWDRKCSLSDRLVYKQYLSPSTTLEDVCKVYFHSCQEKIVEASEWRRLELMENSMLNASNTRGKQFMTPLQNEKTKDKYSNYLSLLVSFYLESINFGTQTTAATTVSALERELQICTDPKETQVQDLLQQVLSNILMVEYHKDRHEKDLWIFKFIMTSCCDDQGKFIQGARITSKLAMLKSIIRSVALSDVIEGNDLDKVSFFVDSTKYTPFGLVSRMSSHLTSICSKSNDIPKAIFTDDDQSVVRMPDNSTISIQDIGEYIQKVRADCVADTCQLLCISKLLPTENFNFGASNNQSRLENY